MKININLFDLYKLVGKLELQSSDQLFKRNLIRLVSVQNGVWTPQIVYKEFPFTFCPWLINDMGDDGFMRGFCSLHPFDKPLICKMAPVSRIVDFEKEKITYELTAPTDNCPGMDRSCENRLSDLKEELEQELDYEYRFYKILDRLIDRDLEKSFFEDFYSFDGSREFEEILKEREDPFS